MIKTRHSKKGFQIEILTYRADNGCAAAECRTVIVGRRRNYQTGNSTAEDQGIQPPSRTAIIVVIFVLCFSGSCRFARAEFGNLTVRSFDVDIGGCAENGYFTRCQFSGDSGFVKSNC